ncbi:MAG: hypothetical protein AAF414_13275 [Pseudomonadota bacterium]
MDQRETGNPKRRRYFADRMSQTMALFLAFYVLFLLTPAIDWGYQMWIGYELAGWVSVLVVALGVLCTGVYRGGWHQKYWQIPKIAFMLSFVFASEDVVTRMISMFAMKQDPHRYAIGLEGGFGYGMAFYWFSLAFFFVYLFLIPGLSPEYRVASDDQDGKRESSDSARK